jgi:hypothetical protein
MPADSERKAVSEAVKGAQKEFLRQTSSAHGARRKAFDEARKAGLTLREIGELAGLHHTTDLFPKHDHAWVWRSINELPDHKARRRQPKSGSSDDPDPGKTTYCSRLVGRPAVDTLRDGLESCEWVARLLEPQRLR